MQNIITDKVQITVNALVNMLACATTERAKEIEWYIDLYARDYVRSTWPELTTPERNEIIIRALDAFES